MQRRRRVKKVATAQESSELRVSHTAYEVLQLMSHRKHSTQTVIGAALRAFGHMPQGDQERLIKLEATEGLYKALESIVTVTLPGPPPRGVSGPGQAPGPVPGALPGKILGPVDPINPKQPALPISNKPIFEMVEDGDDD